MDIGIIGAGYVGLTTGICLASGNHKISIFDEYLATPTIFPPFNNKGF